MTEYIEREAALRVIRRLLTPAKSPAQREMIRMADANILKIPPADVAPVVHWRWKYFQKKNIAVCTNCSFERNLDDNFGRAVSCHNCGARMNNA